LTTPVPALPDSYLRAVLALPDDDGPRLCAADWWDEQGAAERAEFVRVQVTLAANPGLEHCTEASANWCPVCGDCRCPGPEESKCDEACPLHRPDSPHGEYEALWRRERELRTYDNIISWLPVVEPWGAFLSATCASHLGPGDAHCCNGPSPIARAEFRRGFVEEITVSAAGFLAHADALTAACPLRRVRLTTRPGLSFGEVIYRNRSGETPGPGGYVRSATWDVLAEGGADDMGNVQLVHAIVNSMKGMMSQADFVRWCRLVSDRQM
jgi:uncharacterized protein (TIGR02996 family)